jgi:hypothetical protein
MCGLFFASSGHCVKFGREEPKKHGFDIELEVSTASSGPLCLNVDSLDSESTGPSTAKEDMDFALPTPKKSPLYLICMPRGAGTLSWLAWCFFRETSWDY